MLNIRILIAKNVGLALLRIALNVIIMISAQSALLVTFWIPEGAVRGAQLGVVGAHLQQAVSLASNQLILFN